MHTHTKILIWKYNLTKKRIVLNYDKNKGTQASLSKWKYCGQLKILNSLDSFENMSKTKISKFHFLQSVYKDWSQPFHNLIQWFYMLGYSQPKIPKCRPLFLTHSMHVCVKTIRVTAAQMH